MPRPIMDVRGSEYQKLLNDRHLQKKYKQGYPQMKWALDILDKLEQKTAFEIFSREDRINFEKAKAIIHGVEDTKEETQSNHTTPKYIWRTRGDGNVRSRHAQFNGKTFSWDNPPSGGYHPGEDYGCRCTAEAYQSGEILQERVSQIVTNMVNDQQEWAWYDFVSHYYFGKGKAVHLSEIGFLQKTIDHARTIIFSRVEDQVINKSRQNGEGDFLWGFNNAYDFKPVTYEFGRSTVNGEADVIVMDKGQFWKITADVYYSYYDEFTDVVDVGQFLRWLNKKPKKIASKPINSISSDTIIKPARKPELGEYDLPFSTPYKILGAWRTRIEVVVKK